MNENSEIPDGSAETSSDESQPSVEAGPPAEISSHGSTDPELLIDDLPSIPDSSTSQTESSAPAIENDELGINAPPADERLELLSLRIEESIKASTDQLLELFESKLVYDASKQLQIDRLHEELQQHRGDLLGRAVRPYVHAMIQLHDDVGKQISGYRAKPDRISPDSFFSVLESLQDDVEQALGQCGITPYQERGVAFDPKRQSALKTEVCDDEEAAGTVKESIRPGFEKDGDIVEKERVSVYKLGAPPDGDEPSISETE